MKTLFLIGLGRMGSALAYRLKNRGWEIYGYSRTQTTRERAKKDLGIKVLNSYENLKNFPSPKTVWLMVPHTAVDEVLQNLKPFLNKGDTVIDGGNSYYKDSQRRYRELKEVDVNFLDVGVSGGILGKDTGFSFMIGGDEEVFKKHEKLFKDLAYEEKGYAYLGSSGAGHFAKMVHNGIEYGIMEAIAEGFELLKKSPFDYDLREVARVYSQGSVIRSFLIDLLVKAFEDFGDLEDVEGYVEDSGEGRWCVKESVELGAPIPVIAQSFYERFSSREKDLFKNKVLAVLRYEFGRHRVKKKD
ncbi:phosphogluconate dehydrogenase (NAD(+)-dependent, decarboxylating) [Aquifex aeolicus]|uniref:6-phosphogluconate dehydrogenase n=1 Tax=Aquifex aeolicus (strain VF5) TaxID=224324 RepID=O66788_AQUAE|nr:decarboxylating 6-phosphogluconate dehydrogenase [Aquifex aeolicus]AAC06739.1 6-phosphogluconate dehydrogenase [Aquifex aeolicus VF5]